MKKHVNIPIFIPHYGCPNDCVFCNQKKITGKPCFERQAVIDEINASLSSLNSEETDIEIALWYSRKASAEKSDLDGFQIHFAESGKVFFDCAACIFRFYITASGGDFFLVAENAVVGTAPVRNEDRDNSVLFQINTPL